jgi:hypothetical protein
MQLPRTEGHLSLSHFLTLSLLYFITPPTPPASPRRGGDGSFEFRVMSFELGVWLTRCVVKARAFRKPEGRGDAKGRAEESRGIVNFEFSILN